MKQRRSIVHARADLLSPRSSTRERAAAGKQENKLGTLHEQWLLYAILLNNTIAAGKNQNTHHRASAFLTEHSYGITSLLVRLRRLIKTHARRIRSSTAPGIRISMCTSVSCQQDPRVKSKDVLCWQRGNTAPLVSARLLHVKHKRFDGAAANWSAKALFVFGIAQLVERAWSKSDASDSRVLPHRVYEGKDTTH